MSEILDINTETGEEILRNMTEEEKDLRAQIAQQIAEAEAIKEIQAQAKAALLEKLGITDDEAKLLLS